MKTPFFRAVSAIVRKDLQAELRSFELISTMGMFALLSILIFSFALELNLIARQESVSGVLWVTVVFASILGLNRSLAAERDQGNLDAMLLAPVDRSAVFFGKFTGNFIFTLTVGVLLLPIMSVLYNIGLLRLDLLLLLTLGTLGFSSIGTLLATMTVQTRARESLLPIVILPMALPIVLSAVRATSSILANAPTSDWTIWFSILAAIDVLYVTLCFLLFGFVVED